MFRRNCKPDVRRAENTVSLCESFVHECLKSSLAFHKPAVAAGCAAPPVNATEMILSSYLQERKGPRRPESMSECVAGLLAVMPAPCEQAALTCHDVQHDVPLA